MIKRGIDIIIGCYYRIIIIKLIMITRFIIILYKFIRLCVRGKTKNIVFKLYVMVYRIRYGIQLCYKSLKCYNVKNEKLNIHNLYDLIMYEVFYFVEEK